MKHLIDRKLNLIATGRSGEPITREDEYPPCFKDLSQYRAWLDSVRNAEQTGVQLPERKAWSGEPNYCQDCSPDYRTRMRNDGRCLFPYTIFVEEGEDIDVELIGTEDV